MKYIIYTDGATSNNGYENSSGGWGYIILRQHEDSEDLTIIKTAGGAIKPATNNICELTAVIEACKQIDFKANDEIEIYSDSAYIINCYKNKWYINWLKNGWINSKKEPVKNRELWEQLIPFFNDPRFNFIKVKGHNEDKTPDAYWNNYVDRLAVEAKSLF